MGRAIRYLGEYRDGERLRGCGFARLEYEGDRLVIELSVRGIGGAMGEYPVWLLRQGGESQAGKLQLVEGAGSLIQELQMEEEVTGIRIPLGEGWEIGAFWGVENGKGRSWKEGTGKGIEEGSTGERAGKGEKEETRGSTGKSEKGGTGESGNREYEREKNREYGNTGSGGYENERKREAEHRENGGRGRNWKEGTGKSEDEGIREGAGEKTSENRKMSMKEREIIQEEIGRGENRASENRMEATGNQAPVDFLEEEKWEQLWKLYPRIRPFRDDREYLSVTPADFVILPEGSYRNAHNSFLMHGFYRYHHLLLFRYEKKGEVIYYLGVPGNFHEQDRQVAVMFGFESFECAAEPAQEGDFGYFLMRTEL